MIEVYSYSYIAHCTAPKPVFIVLAAGTRIRPTITRIWSPPPESGRPPTSMPTYLLLLLSCTLAHGQTDSDLGLIEATDNLCPLTHECVPQETCAHFQEDVARLENLSIESLEYEELVEELKRGVCNKEERGFCCSSIQILSVVPPSRNKCCR